MRRALYRNRCLLCALATLAAAVLGSSALPQEPARKFDQEDKFRQLEELLPTPNSYRTASGAPGHEYWQQEVDYEIHVEIDEDNHHLSGRERVFYTNHSPDTLKYLWVQLENNLLAPDSAGVRATPAPSFDGMSYRALQRLLHRRAFDGSVDVTRVAGMDGALLPHTVVGTMMRVDLPEPLVPEGSAVLEIDWNFAINRHDQVSSRTGYEWFEADGNPLYEMAHWFPRLAAYTDVNGWQHKQFLGRGEFTLEFGDYVVHITVPEDYVVASTGELQNPEAVLSEVQRERLARARGADEPVMIVTREEAEANEQDRAPGTRTWTYAARNVRDFAFAASRKFLWDAMSCPSGDAEVLCMSYWPREGEPLWSRYSTHAIAHTIEVYDEHCFDYPYPVAISVNGPVGGMEYPMICFNGPRPEEDGTYTPRTKYGLISVIIHEVGHNYFPMIVNSDERQWTWMDEGLNTFVQFLAEQRWEEDYPSRRGEPHKIVEYMISPNQVPIMTNSESIHQFGANAYAKPATALNILRESILGRELFDHAFREYSQRWMFKRPQPADLFRSLEDASGVDLDWFWRGWFYSTDHVDVALVDVELHRVDSRDPDLEKPLARSRREELPRTATQRENEGIALRTDRFPDLLDFYNEFDDLDVTPQDRSSYEKMLGELDEEERRLLGNGLYFYVLSFENRGGLVMPLYLRTEDTEGRQEDHEIPAEIWRHDNQRVRKLILSDRELVRFELDPELRTADADLENNHWPPRALPSRFQLFKDRKKSRNPMQQAHDSEQNHAGEGGGGSRP